MDKIYIHSPDRLSRKSTHQMILLDEFEKAGVEVIFLNHKTESLDLVILIDGHQKWEWLEKSVHKRLQEELAKLEVEVNKEKTKIVNSILFLLCYQSQ
ncbi:recombinase family protein, partial [Wolbachia endosymbiont of Glossina morsitans morsitans]|uniref:recombinase family protein n=1 Tax=Wolbachia endosymbiont of Glossina morsitans morsitans TaxID=1150948 RepID=UPI001F11A4FF